jgi:hypothetical protein
MRRQIFLVALVLSACGGSNGNGDAFEVAPESVQHVPQISNLTLSPSSASWLEGDGSVVVTVELTFRDVGLDLRALRLGIPGGTSILFSESFTTVTGTISEEFNMPTTQVGVSEVEIWLEDLAGNSSVHHVQDFVVTSDVQSSDREWTLQLSGLSFVLNDVAWTGTNFVAVGDSGVILTSPDGVDWAEQASGTDVDLNAVAADGTDVVAVGYDATVLLSIDDGQTWGIKHGLDRMRLAAVTMSASQIVAGGMNLNTGEPFMIRSLDRGAHWTVVDSLPETGHFVSDLLYANGMYIAGTDQFSWDGNTHVWVSVTGDVWHDVILRNTSSGIYTLLHDGTQFFAGGSDDHVFTSLDGYNWIELPTPVDRVSYLSSAWSGSEVLMAGGIDWFYWWGETVPDFERDIGLASIDGGLTWEVFNIDGYFVSNGMAWGNGRYVSVGQTTPIAEEGAIYTSD